MGHCKSYDIECPYALESEMAPVPCVGSKEACETFRAFKDYDGPELSIGDQVQVKGTPLEFEIKGFKSINGNPMVESQYGDFHLDLIEKLKTTFNED